MISDFLPEGLRPDAGELYEVWCAAGCPIVGELIVRMIGTKLLELRSQGVTSAEISERFFALVDAHAPNMRAIVETVLHTAFQELEQEPQRQLEFLRETCETVVQCGRARGLSEHQIREEALGIAHDWAVERRHTIFIDRQAFITLAKQACEEAIRGRIDTGTTHAQEPNDAGRR